MNKRAILWTIFIFGLLMAANNKMAEERRIRRMAPGYKPLQPVMIEPLSRDMFSNRPKTDAEYQRRLADMNRATKNSVAHNTP